MNRKVESIDADSSIVDVAERFLHSDYRHFPVQGDCRLVGQIIRHDIMRAIDDV